MAWPKASLRNEEQGNVGLAFLIGADGKVVDSRIDKSSGFPLLDAAAQTGIGKCTFKPASVDGKAVEKWVTMQYVWSLR